MTEDSRADGTETLKAGDRIVVTDLGKEYIGRWLNFQDWLTSDGLLFGTVVTNKAFVSATLDGYPDEAIPFGEGEVERAPLVAPKPTVSVVEIAELLTTYRTSDNDDEVSTAQELLLELFSDLMQPTTERR